MTKQVEKAFAALTAFHRIVGSNTSPCSWADYRETVIAMFGLDGSTLDAMARLGHFAVKPRAVRFIP